MSRASAVAVLLAFASCADSVSPPPNILMIVADDLNWNSVGCYGSPVEGVTPNIDRLAAEGMRFGRGHVTIAACQPSRSVWMTGRYPHRNGAEGFEPIDAGVPTLVEELREAGYTAGILGKVQHLQPESKFGWDHRVTSPKMARGRDPKRYGEEAAEFFRRAKKTGRPFFLMANSHDPKRPFPGSLQESQLASLRGREFPATTRVFGPDEVEVPAFLPDLPEVRLEVAQYFTAVHRFDAMLGAVLEALSDAGLERDTVVLFMSDHGMAFPFGKMNCYLDSTKVPFIVRWPGEVAPGSTDERHFVSGIDVMPTLLEIAGIEQPGGIDGRSFRRLLAGEEQPGRDRLVTVFGKTNTGVSYPMRCIHERGFGYVFNGWADGVTVLEVEGMSGLTYGAMVAAAQEDSALAARVEHLVQRVPEELYDFDNDPHALVNLVDDPAHADVVERLRGALLAHLEEYEDPLLEQFREWVAR